jgi:hypothetical protein
MYHIIICMEGLADPNLDYKSIYSLSQTWNNKPLYLKTEPFSRANEQIILGLGSYAFFNMQNA